MYAGKFLKEQHSVHLLKIVAFAQRHIRRAVEIRQLIRIRHRIDGSVLFAGFSAVNDIRVFVGPLRQLHPTAFSPHLLIPLQTSNINDQFLLQQKALAKVEDDGLAKSAEHLSSKRHSNIVH